MTKQQAYKNVIKNPMSREEQLKDMSVWIPNPNTNDKKCWNCHKRVGRANAEMCDECFLND